MKRLKLKATGWSYWYVGVIVGVDDIAGLYTIKFEDGETNNTIQEFQIEKY